MRVDDIELRGRVLRAGDSGYDTARRVFNAMIDRHPALILRCADVEDVVSGVTFARTHALPLTVKGGGHGVAGHAVCDKGLLLDLSTMKGLRVDPDRRVATVQAGVTLGDLDRATQAFGLATPTGVVSMTGLSGLALGGGLGWLSGQYGLTCDNLLAVDLVAASADRITASAQENQDLFWGLRGGGGNFGVATSFTVRLHPVDQVLAGAVTYPPSKARAALRVYRELASTSADQLSANASVCKSPEGDAAVSVAVCYTGAVADGDQLLVPLRKLGPESDAIQPMSYRALQQASDDTFPPGQQHYWKSGWLTVLGDDVIDLMVEGVAKAPSETSAVGLQQLHGAAARIDPTDTAFAHRGPRYDCLILSQWPDPADSPRNIAWTRELFAALQPFFGASVYVNNLGDEGAHRVKQAYGPNYEHLVALKTKYDPTNFFHHNQNIPPHG